MPAYLLGIDVGTSRIRAAVFDCDGREIRHASRNAETDSPRPGWSQQDMTGVWRATAAAIREALVNSAVSAAAIAAVGPSGQGDGAWIPRQRGPPAGSGAAVERQPGQRYRRAMASERSPLTALLKRGHAPLAGRASTDHGLDARERTQALRSHWDRLLLQRLDLVPTHRASEHR